MPHRIQRQRVKGWRLPQGAKIVDRSTRWGNPFAIKRMSDSSFQIYDKRSGRHITVRPTREAAHAFAVAEYRDFYIKRSPLMEQLDTLRGHNLACPCPLDLPCHADVLLELANG